MTRKEEEEEEVRTSIFVSDRFSTKAVAFASTGCGPKASGSSIKAIFDGSKVSPSGILDVLMKPRASSGLTVETSGTNQTRGITRKFSYIRASSVSSTGRQLLVFDSKALPGFELLVESLIKLTFSRIIAPPFPTHSTLIFLISFAPVKGRIAT